VKEPSKNRNIWVQVLFGYLRGLWFCSVWILAHFLFLGSVWFLAKPGFRLGLFLLGSDWILSHL